MSKRSKKNIYIESERSCRHCDELLLEVRHKEIKEKHKKQPFYYERWFKCLKCKRLYMNEEDKHFNNNEMSEFVQFKEETANLFKSLQ